MKKIIKLLSFIVVVPIFIILAIYILVLAITQYSPKTKVTLVVKNNKTQNISINNPFTITTFNIGYCGMDMYQDFFMDGGKGSRSSSKAKTLENLTKNTSFLSKNNSDIYFLQEVDENSTRSDRVNEYEYITKTMADYSSTFAYNFKVLWVPLPITKPHGNVKAGILTLSKFNISSSTRYQYPGNEPWIVQLAALRRCFIESRLTVDNGKELILINSHLSAFDPGGVIRKKQLAFLKSFITSEYTKGNYVIAGGDWNHVIPGTDPTIFKTTEKWPSWLKKIPSDFKPEGFQWVADASVPTNRSDSVPYKKDRNFTAVIDGFLVSPNVELVKVATESLDFKYTDHNPVTGTFKLK